MITASPTSHSYISQRLKLHYVDWGNPQATPLLLLHGGRDHCRSWDWVADRLRADWHVMATDLHGHGDKSWASNPEKDARVSHFRHARVVNFANAGHWVHHDQLDAFMNVLEGFLQAA